LDYKSVESTALQGLGLYFFFVILSWIDFF
jgi:hypothetical protein